MILPNSVDQLAKFHGLLPWENCRILLPPVYELIEKFLCDKAGRARAHTTHTFNGFFSGTTQVSRYQNGKTNLDSTEARDSEWQWHQLSHMQLCT